MKEKSETAPRDQWVLIRRARQLLTLRGPSGPRRGAALKELQVINDGAVLIHNGTIVESGPTQRIENLLKARAAREIDALGRIVMPAFADPDAALVSPPADFSRMTGAVREKRLRVLSRKRLESDAVSQAATLARHGVLTLGAHTMHASDLRDTTKILRVHQALQGKPLRIRSVFSPADLSDAESLIVRWLPAVRKRKLASVLELSFSAAGSGHIEELRNIASAAAGDGFSLRVRTAGDITDECIRLVADTGAIGIVSPSPPSAEKTRRLAAAGCVQIFPAMTIAERAGREEMRAMIGEGSAVALSSNREVGGTSSSNPQYLLHIAKDRLGMTDEEAIMAVTWNAASTLRAAHATGSIEPGKAADLIVMDAPDYRELARRPGHCDVQLAMRAGRVVYRRSGLISD